MSAAKKPPPKKGGGNVLEEDETCRKIVVNISGILTLLDLTPEELEAWEVKKEQLKEEALAAASSGKGKGDNSKAPKKGGKDTLGESQVVLEPIPPAVLKDPYFEFQFPGEPDACRTNSVDAVEFNLAAGEVLFTVTKSKIMELCGQDVMVTIYSNEPIAEAREETPLDATKGSKKGGKDAKKDDKGKKGDKKGDKKGQAGLAGATHQYISVASFTFSMAQLVMGSTSDTVVMVGEDPDVQEVKYRQQFYGFDKLVLTASIADDRGPLLSPEETDDWIPMVVTVGSLSNMADNTRTKSFGQEPDFSDQAKACEGPYVKYQFFPDGPVLTSPKFAHASHIGIFHRALFFLGDGAVQGLLPTNLDGTRTSTLLKFLKHYTRNPFVVEVHDRDPLEPLPPPALENGDGDARPSSAETTHKPKEKKKSSNPLQHGVVNFSLETITNGEVVLKATEPIVCKRPQLEEKEGESPADNLEEDPNAITSEEDEKGDEMTSTQDKKGAGEDKGALVYINPGNYLQWSSTLSMKFTLAKPLPFLNYVVHPERALPVPEGWSSVPPHVKALLAEPGTITEEAANAMALQAFNPPQDTQCAICPLGLFTRLCLIMPYHVRPAVLHVLMKSLMATPKAVGEDDDVRDAIVPTYAIATEDVGGAEEDPKGKPGAKGKAPPKTPEGAKPKSAATPKTGSGEATEEDSSATPEPNPEDKEKQERLERRHNLRKVRLIPKRKDCKVMVTNTISGFEVIDGQKRIWVLEGISHSALQKVVDAVVDVIDDSDGVKIMYNNSVPFAKRNYMLWPPLTVKPTIQEEKPEEPEEVEDTGKTPKKGKGKDAKDKGKKGAKEEVVEEPPKVNEGPTAKELQEYFEAASNVDGVGGRIHRLRLTRTLNSIASQQNHYIKRQLSGRLLDCVDKLIRLSRAKYLKDTVKERMYPDAAALIELEKIFGTTLSNQDISGDNEYIMIDGEPQKISSNSQPAEDILAVPDGKSSLDEEETRSRHVNLWEIEEEVEPLSPSTDLAGMIGSDITVVAKIPHPDQIKALPPLQSVLSAEKRARMYMVVPDLNKCIVVVLPNDVQVPTAPIRYKCVGKLSRASLDGRWTGLPHPPEIYCIKTYSFQEAVAAEHEKTTLHHEFTKHKAREKAKQGYATYGREMQKRQKYWDVTHKRSTQRTQAEAAGGGYESEESSDDEREEMYDGDEKKIGLVVPPPFKAVQTDYRVTNVKKYPGNKNPSRRINDVRDTELLKDYEGEVYNYSSQRLNITDVQKEKIREKYETLGKHAVYGSGIFGQSVCTVDLEGTMRQEKAKAAKHAKAFQGLQTTTNEEDNKHPKAPPESRVADLNEPWNAPKWPFGRPNPKTNFDLYGKGEKIFGHRVGSVFPLGDQDELDKQHKELKEWQDRIVVEDTRFHVDMTHKNKPDVIDKYMKSMLKDDPKKLSLKMADSHKAALMSLSAYEPYGSPPKQAKKQTGGYPRSGTGTAKSTGSCSASFDPSKTSSDIGTFYLYNKEKDGLSRYPNKDRPHIVPLAPHEKIGPKWG